MRVPTMSDGSRSGVNCTRPNVPPTTFDSVSAASVLARPGTLSSRQCPWLSSPTSIRSISLLWPTMTLRSSKNTRSTISAVAGSSCGKLVVTVMGGFRSFGRER